MDAEKLKRVQELEKYADALLDHILEKAKAEMNEVGKGEAKETETDGENGNGASND